MASKKKKPVKKTLSDKEWQFVVEYLLDYNATKAAIRAGYSERSAYSTGHDILKKPEVKKEIAQAKKEIRDRSFITKEELLAHLIEIQQADILNYIDPETVDGLKDLKAASNSRAIKQLKISTKINDAGDEFRDITITLHDPIKANESIRKMLGLDDEQETNDKIEITINHVADNDTKKKNCPPPPKVTIKRG